MQSFTALFACLYVSLYEKRVPCVKINAMRFLVFSILAIAILFPFAVQALEGTPFRVTNLPLPRYVSLSSEEVHVRAGPGLQYPILWQFRREHLPVEITLEYDAWRKIRDYEGQEGWVHVSLLSGARYGLIVGKAGTLVRRKPQPDSGAVAELEPFVVARIQECKSEWCEVSSGGYSGWVYKNFLWGVYAAEEFN